MSDLVPRPTHPAAPADGDHRYKSVQHKLKTLTQALDGAGSELGVLVRMMGGTADHALALADDIAHAQLDTKFVEMTSAVHAALLGAGTEVGILQAMAEDVAGEAGDTRRTHARAYERLDEVRSNRPERTPKPGFLIRKN